MASKKRKASRKKKKGGWPGFADGIKDKPVALNLGRPKTKLGLEKRKAEKPITILFTMLFPFFLNTIMIKHL